MAGPVIGQVYDGYVYKGGDPNSADAWADASVQDVAAARAAGTVMGKEAGTFQANQGDSSGDALGLIREAGDVQAALRESKGTGTFAPVALGVARAGVPLVSNEKKARSLGAVERAANAATLQNAGNLKGALSDKDVSFLKSLTFNLKSATGENTDVARAQQWAGAKALGYNAARSAWEKRLGSAQAKNKSGQSFADWWTSYAEQKYPRPSFGGEGVYKPAKKQSGGQSKPTKTQSGASVSNW